MLVLYYVQVPSGAGETRFPPITCSSVIRGVEREGDYHDDGILYIAA